MIKITDKQKEILKKYKIDYKDFENVKDLLIEIDDEMTSHVDKNDEPLAEFKELESLYDEIYNNNK